MATKHILLSVLILAATHNIAFGMDNSANNNNSEEAIFQANVGQLKQPIAEFVMDFKTWPKEEQNKIETYRLKDSKGYYVNGKPAASDKYNTPYGLGFWLDCRLTQQQITPFLDAIDYLKKQQ